MLVLITIWIAVLLLPSISMKLGLEKFRRRWVKEFCWALFGLFFTLEIVIFIYVAFSKELISSSYGAQYGTLLSILLTFPATWNYIKADQFPYFSEPRKRFEWHPIVEHIVIYFVAYVIFQWILWYTGTTSIP
jgi:hypothetical protein